MRVIEFYDVNAFFNEYGQILLEKEAAGQFILYNVFMCLKGRAAERMIFGSVISEQGVHLLFCKTSSHGIVIYEAGKERILQAVEALVDYLAAEDFSVEEIRGNNNVCISFIDRYSKKHADCSFVKMTEMNILEIRKIHDIKQADGIQRLARPDEIQFVTDWMIESQFESKSSEMDYELMQKKAAGYIDDNKVYLFEKDEIVVSMAIKEHELVKGVLLAYIFTPEEYRGKGYAVANVYYLSKALLKEGYEFCTMLVDKKNPLSVRAYEKIGYVLIDDIYDYKVYPVDD